MSIIEKIGEPNIKERINIKLEEGMTEKMRTKINNDYNLVIFSTTGYIEHLQILIQDREKNSNVFDLAELKEDQDLIFASGDAFFFRQSSKLLAVAVDQLRDPRKIFLLLHELGHSINSQRKDRLPEIGDLDYLNQEDKPEVARAILEEERTAWANAIKLARRIRQNCNVDLFKLFTDLNEFDGWLKVESLHTYEDYLGSFLGHGQRDSKSKQTEAWKKRRREEWVAEEEKLRAEIEPETKEMLE